ncbi:MAG: alpha/beta hydrolase [Lachnospiraceae bacterium]|nr:alpha/beta hydrolase [Lachnospiraceae bacterium]
MDIKHHYIEKGQGDVLILLHGNGENCDYFCHQMDAFSKDYHVIAIDTRGHGKTPRGEKPFTIRQFAEDLFCFMKEKEISKAHILGFSDGGNIAMIFAMEHPECMDRLILNGANLDTRGVKRSVQLPIEIGYRISKVFARKNEKAQAKAELLGLMVNDPNVSPSELAKIQAKTLVIAGTKDVILEKQTRLIADSIPNAICKIIEGDHFIANKNAKEFNAIVLHFLKE